MATHSLYEEHNFFADWKLPGESLSISGNLHFAKDKVELSLNDGFSFPSNGSFSFTDLMTDYPVLHGVSGKFGAMSVLEARQFGINITMDKLGNRFPGTFIPKYVVLGDHVNMESAYSAIRAYVPGLEIWLNSSAISGSLELNEDNTISQKTYIVKELDAEKIFSDCLDACICFGVSVNDEFAFSRSLSINLNGYVDIRPSVPKTIDWYLSQWQKLESFLTFAAGMRMPADSMQLLTQGGNILSLLFKMREWERCSAKNHREFFISKNQLEPEFLSCVVAWLREIESVLEPCQLAMSVIGSHQTWAHVEFLSLIQALEGFHRARFADESKISLQSRLNYIQKELGEDLSSLVIGGKGGATSDWVATRNYLSHWDSGMKLKALQGKDMSLAAVRMKALVTMLFLRMAEVSTETLIASMGGQSSFARYLMQINSENFEF